MDIKLLVELLITLEGSKCFTVEIFCFNPLLIFSKFIFESTLLFSKILKIVRLKNQRLNRMY